jgi:predicted ATPase with chaperone activity
LGFHEGVFIALEMSINLKTAFPDLNYHFKMIGTDGDVVRTTTQMSETHQGTLDLLRINIGLTPAKTLKRVSYCVHPCPCGHFGDSQKACTCAPAVVTKYQKRISGPLLDRIDIHIEVPRVDYEKLSGNILGESSETIRKRVQTARDIQHTRFTNHQSTNSRSTDVLCNADMRIGEVRQFCQLQPEGQSLMRAAMSQLNLSARAYHRILKLSRTIADLAGSEDIQSTHLAEALQYRPKIMNV